MIWVISTDSVNCRIYHYEKTASKLSLIKQLEHPENRLKKEEFLTSDKPGHFKSGVSNRGAYSPRTDPKEVEIDNFAREIARELENGRTNHNYTQLIIIAPPHMEGLIFQHADKHVKELVSNKISKDLQHYTDNELLEFLKTHTQYPDT